MVLELYDLIDSATGGADHHPIESKYWSAAMMPLMVGLGGLHRFFANEVRSGKAGMASKEQWWLGYGGFIMSCVIFGLVVASILDPLVAERCADGVVSTRADETCPITDANLKNDRTAAYILTLTWIGYPMVVIATSIMQALQCPEDGHTKTYAYISFFKDLSYGLLDVASKGGACFPRAVSVH
tara:strand:- start:1783 stop:2334 length:552 start_codon:yes stop_codon:yes gene_type:complete